MKHSRTTTAAAPAWSVFPELAPVEQSGSMRLRDRLRLATNSVTDPAPEKVAQGNIRATTLSFANMSQHGDLLVSFLKARKRIFIDRLNWDLPESDGMEFDQYDTPLARWIVIHQFGEILGGFRLTPTTAKCGIYSYMLRDAQKGILDSIPSDVLFFDAPVDNRIWEASRLFISEDVPARSRIKVHSLLMSQMTEASHELGAMHVIGIVPALWSRWLRRLGLDAVPVGPKFGIDGTVTQAALFNVNNRVN